MSQHFQKAWMAQNRILACGGQPVLPLHSSRSSSHWTQMTLGGKLKLNAPQMESSKNWMHCLVSALCSFLHRERKQEVNPPLPTTDTRKQVIFSLYFHWFWVFMLFMSPWAGTALAGLSVEWCPGEAAWVVLTASLIALRPPLCLMGPSSTAWGWLLGSVSSYLFLMWFSFTRVW